jgi:hypothetical protein
MITKLQNINKTDLNGMSREDVFRLLSVLGEWKTDDDKNTVYRTDIERMSKESGSPTVKDFLIRLGYIPNPSVKKTRTVITKEVRQNIVTDLKNGVPTKDISSKYGVKDDSIYKIKGEEKLTKPKTKKVPTTTTVTVPTPTTDNPTTVPTPTVTVSPTTVPTPMVSETPSILTPTVPSPELTKGVV